MLLLIDGNNLFIASYIVVPEMDNNGEHVGGMMGFLRSLGGLIERFDADQVIVVWDGPGGSRYRRGIFAEYKAGRKPRVNREYEFDESSERADQNLIFQHKRVRAYLKAFGIPQVELEDIEADDVIAVVAGHLRKDKEKVIVSSDRDFFQLIDQNTAVYSHTRKMVFDTKAIMEEYGVLPENFIYSKMITGDGSDKIEGIKGIGKKTVPKLFPFLAERPSTFMEVMEYARANEGKSKKFSEIAGSQQRLHKNVELMQLSVPVIGSASIAKVRGVLDSHQDEPVLSSVKVMILRDGITLHDNLLFERIRMYHARRKRFREKNDGRE